MSNQKGFGNIVYGAVGLVVFLILVTSIIMPTIVNADTAGTGNKVCYTAGPPPAWNQSCPWSVPTIAMWGIVPIVVVASAILFVIGKK